MLTSEQLQIVEHWGSGSAILAGAGSGKTTTLIEKCKRLIEKKPDASIVAVSFTEKSAQDLRLRLGQLVSSEDLHYRHWITTIHGLCWKLLRENPGPAGLDGEEIVLSELQARQIWEEAMEKLWFGDLKPELSEALSRLLDRESRTSIEELIARVVRLESFEVYDSILNSPDDDTRALGQISNYVSYHYRNGKKRLGGVDFDDLEKGALKVLESESIRQQYHRRFDLVLVDEFQDTNLVQSKIIWNFAKPDLSNLCVVGDPKQSIYRFRDADVELFEEKTHLLKHRFELTWNFRSRPEIIHFVNEVCDPIFRASNMEYLSLHPKRESEENGVPRVLRLNLEQPADLGLWVKKEVAAGRSLGEIAIVMRKIKGNEVWIKGLEAAGVPCVVGSGGLFWESPGVRELVCLLKWWNNPANELSAVTFLRAPWVGIEDDQIDQWLQEGANLIDAFLGLNHPIAEGLRPLKGLIIRPAQVIMSVLVNESVEAEVGQDALGLWARAEELSSAGRSFSHVVDELARSMDEGRRESLVPPPSDQGQLKIFTVHGSKGLEFEHVIVLDLKGKTRSAPSPLMFWDRNKGAFLGKRTDSGDRDRKVEKPWREIEQRQSLAESKRLFYVALTRAKESLTLVMDQHLDCEHEVDESCFNEDNWRDWVLFSVSKIEVETFQPQDRSIEVTEPKNRIKEWQPKRFDAVAKRRARHSATEWVQLKTCPLSYWWSFIDRPLEKLKFDDGIEPDSSVNVGSQIHSAFENQDSEVLYQLEKELGSEVLDAQEIDRWMKTSPLMQGQFDQVWREWPFEVMCSEDVLVGAIDRLCLKGNRYYLVDFKYSRKKKAKKDLWAQYQFQLDFYSFAIATLDPKISMGERTLEQCLVNIYPAGVSVDQKEVSLTRFNQISKTLSETLALANRVINGSQLPVATPGVHCRYCDFNEICPSAQRSLKTPTSQQEPKQIDMFLT